MSDESVLHAMLGDAQRELIEFKQGMAKVCDERDAWREKYQRLLADGGKDSRERMDPVLALRDHLAAALAILDQHVVPHREALADDGLEDAVLARVEEVLG